MAKCQIKICTPFDARCIAAGNSGYYHEIAAVHSDKCCIILQHNTCSLSINAETLQRLVTQNCTSLPSTELMAMGRYQLSRGQFFPYSRSRKVSQPSSSQVRQEAGRVIIAGKKVEKTAHEFSSLTSNDPSSFNNS